LIQTDAERENTALGVTAKMEREHRLFSNVFDDAVAGNSAANLEKMEEAEDEMDGYDHRKVHHFSRDEHAKLRRERRGATHAVHGRAIVPNHHDTHGRKPARILMGEPDAFLENPTGMSFDHIHDNRWEGHDDLEDKGNSEDRPSSSSDERHHSFYDHEDLGKDADPDSPHDQMDEAGKDFMDDGREIHRMAGSHTSRDEIESDDEAEQIADTKIDDQPENDADAENSDVDKEVTSELDPDQHPEDNDSLMQTGDDWAGADDPRVAKADETEHFDAAAEDNSLEQMGHEFEGQLADIVIPSAKIGDVTPQSSFVEVDARGHMRKE